MKGLSIAASIFFILAAAPAMAQTPLADTLLAETPRAETQPADQPSVETNISPGELTATPEMWFYEQNRRDYLDPKLAVRRNAEYRADQRRQRIAAKEWLGISDQRPQARVNPYYADWAPTWTANSSVYSLRWATASWPWAVSSPVVIYLPTGSAY
jgi:hypothetical protein